MNNDIMSNLREESVHTMRFMYIKVGKKQN